MITVGRIHKAARTAAFAVLRHFPRVRLKTRHIYWGIQRRRYEKLANGIAVDSRKVFFEAYGGRSYACSPKALYREMLEEARFAQYSYVWSFHDGKVPTDDPELSHARIVQRGSNDYFRELASAGTIVLNTRLPEYVYPRNGQVFVQCWHGTPLKRLGYDVQIQMESALNTTGELAYRFGLDAQKWSYLLSPSPYASKHLSDAFGLPETRRDRVVLEKGYPRNDVLALARHGEGEAMRRAALRKHGIPDDKKVLLYAPTWRDDSYVSGIGYTFDYLLDFRRLKEELSGDWVVLFRAHYYIANEFDFSAFDGFVLDMSKVDDINELYIAADVLLTDYSSVMFDFANLRRPMMLYVPDRERYEGSIRGFYFDMKEVPGPMCESTQEVFDELRQLDAYFDRFGDLYDRFADRFCPLDDGRSSQRVLMKVFGS